MDLKNQFCSLKAVGYVYCTTNNFSGKLYIGKKHSSKFDPEYWGSGKKIVEAVKRYGEGWFSTVLLVWCYSAVELNATERALIKRYREALGFHRLYNILDGGEGVKGFHWSEESKKKNSASHKGKIFTQEHKHNMSLSGKGRIISDETRKKLSEVHKGKKYRLGTTTSVQGRANIKAAKQNMSQETKDKISAGHRGKSLSAEHKAKISKTNTGRKMPAGTGSKISVAKMGHLVTEETKEKIRQALAITRAAKKSAGIVTVYKKLSPELIARRTATRAKNRAAKIFDNHPHNVEDSTRATVDQIAVSYTDPKSMNVSSAALIHSNAALSSTNQETAMLIGVLS